MRQRGSITPTNKNIREYKYIHEGIGARSVTHWLLTALTEVQFLIVGYILFK
jgi:hypothetical protein